MVYIGKGGYWEGKAAGKHGWFPALAIREVTEDEPDSDTEDECKYMCTSTTVIVLVLCYNDDVST